MEEKKTVGCPHCRKQISITMPNADARLRLRVTCPHCHQNFIYRPSEAHEAENVPPPSTTTVPPKTPPPPPPPPTPQMSKRFSKAWLITACCCLILILGSGLMAYYNPSRNLKIAEDAYADGNYEKAYRHAIRPFTAKGMTQAQLHVMAAKATQKVDGAEPLEIQWLDQQKDFQKVSPRAKTHFHQALEDGSFYWVKESYEECGLYDILLSANTKLPNELTIQFLGTGTNQEMNIQIAKRDAELYRLVIPPLLILQPKGEEEAYQRMIIAEGITLFILPQENSKTLTVETYCLDYSRRPPAQGVVYIPVAHETIISSPDRFSNIGTILTLAKTNPEKYPREIAQRALYVPDGWNRENLKKELSPRPRYESDLPPARIRAIIAEERERKVNQMMTDIQHLLEQAEAYPKEVYKGWLGVSLVNDVSHGAKVERAGKWSPAEKGGIQPGDVIIAFNHTPIQDVKHLVRVVGETPPGESVEVKVKREGAEKVLRVKVGRRTEEAVADLSR